MREWARWGQRRRRVAHLKMKMKGGVLVVGSKAEYFEFDKLAPFYTSPRDNRIGVLRVFALCDIQK